MMQGKAYWAKIVGKPVKGYNEGEFEWSIDVALDEAHVEQVKREGWQSKIKNKFDDRGNFVQFKRKSVKKDGDPAKPIRIVDHRGEAWPDNKLIGNGSTVNVKYELNDPPTGSKVPRVSIIAVQVWDYVPYERKGGSDFPTKDGDEQTGDNW